MSQSVMAYNNLQVSPFHLTYLQELTITKKVNDHARLKFTGVVPDNLKSSYAEMTSQDTPVEISQLDEQGNAQPIFCGMVCNVELRNVRDVYHIVVEAVSHTHQLDVKRESRSFQHKGMAYSALINRVTSEYSGVDVIDHASNGTPLTHFTVQYKETDWEFLKRMASRFDTGLVPAVSFDKPKFFFGVPESSSKGKLEDYHYSIRKGLNRFYDRTRNYVEGIDENEFIYYEVETKEHVMDIGNTVQFQGKRLYVFEAYTEMKESLLKHRYVLSTKQGMKQNRIYLESIIGASLEGKILEVSKDNVKIHLDIDPSQNKGEAHWFPYSSVYTAEGNSGWYCMPEINDTVRAYFPSNKEQDSIALSSVRKDNNEGKNNKLGDPNMKYLRTAGGKEIMFGPSEVVLSNNDGEMFVRLSDDGGIEIISNKDITFVSKENISMTSEKKITITAQEELFISCKESNIKMDGDTIITGNEVKSN
ncbi:contractile injection system protein, VgrG/Pvc8 family [Paenibacillus arenosi]|uniref:Gp5/Type VI secretion system Vgr protein OB-fold domain-containing protein n=1 Tax=Paenibacillus arenosi TaxID=2774142 RepID=A0ABR9AYT5_9BACL|nr:contractile injection system protein, VgrG/Pvc8 family [Paenibacillus arenosi]MBD8498799.1 hypothetical protein [Paenibacillus arenosi]